MARQKGSPKFGGRKKGSINKNTLPLIQKAKELGVDPFSILLMFAKEDWQGLGYESKTRTVYTQAGANEEYVISAELRCKAASEACQYLYPKRKAIEHTGEDGGPIKLQAEMNASVKRQLNVIIKDPEKLSALESLVDAIDGDDEPQ